MNHPAINDLYRIVPTFKHDALNDWIKRWVDVCYAKSTSLDLGQHQHIIAGETKRTRLAVANTAAELGTDHQIDFSNAPGVPPEVIITARCFFLLREPK